MAEKQTADTVDVTGHKVAPQPVRKAQCPLEIDLAALLQVGECGLAQRLLAHISDERAPDEPGDGQACAIHRYRVADGHVTTELGRIDLDLRTSSDTLDPRDDSHTLHQSGEHQ